MTDKLLDPGLGLRIGLELAEMRLNSFWPRSIRGSVLDPT